MFIFARVSISVGGNVVFTDAIDGEIYGDGIGNDDGICNVAETCLTVSTYLKHATEVMDDAIGDDDGLCESGETCIYSPNIGYYQGEGDYTTQSCTFSDGTVSGVTMHAYPTNGQ